MIQVYVVPNEIRYIYLEHVPREIAAEDPMVIGAIDDETMEACGVLCAKLSGNEVELLYIDVDEDRRRSGIGGRMLGLLKVVASGMNADGIAVNYLKTSRGPDDKMEAFEGFLSKHSFSGGDAGKLLRVPMKVMAGKLSAKIKPKPPAMIVSLTKAPTRMWNALRERIREKGIAYDDAGGYDKPDASVFMDPGSIDAYDKDISFIYADKTGRPAGCILLTPHGDGVLLSYLCMLAESVESQKALMGLFTNTFVASIKKYGKDVVLYSNTQNHVSEAIFGKLSGGNEEIVATVKERNIRLN